MDVECLHFNRRFQQFTKGLMLVEFRCLHAFPKKNDKLAEKKYSVSLSNNTIVFCTRDAMCFISKTDAFK